MSTFIALLFPVVVWQTVEDHCDHLRFRNRPHIQQAKRRGRAPTSRFKYSHRPNDRTPSTSLTGDEGDDGDDSRLQATQATSPGNDQRPLPPAKQQRNNQLHLRTLSRPVWSRIDASTVYSLTLQLLPFERFTMSYSSRSPSSLIAHSSDKETANNDNGGGGTKQATATSCTADPALSSVTPKKRAAAAAPTMQDPPAAPKTLLSTTATAAPTATATTDATNAHDAKRRKPAAKNKTKATSQVRAGREEKIRQKAAEEEAKRQYYGEKIRVQKQRLSEKGITVDSILSKLS